MNVLIKGMDMPESCGECQLMDPDYGTCPMIDGYAYVGERQDRHPLCPLKEVKERKDGKTEQSTVRDMPES